MSWTPLASASRSRLPDDRYWFTRYSKSLIFLDRRSWRLPALIWHSPSLSRCFPPRIFPAS